MTTFQLVLAGLAVVLVLGVVLYNWLQERKYRREANRGFSTSEADYFAAGDVPHAAEPLPEKIRIEPHVGLVDTGTVEAGTDAVLSARDENSPEVGIERFEGGIEETFEAELGEPLASNVAEIPESGGDAFVPESSLDRETEYLARLRFSQPARVPFAALLDDLRIAGKPVRAMAKHEGGDWEPLSGAASGLHSAAEFGLQLVDRSGPVTTHQLETFCRVLYEFSAEHGGAVSCQARTEALDRASRLDAFCIEVDFLVGLNVVAPDARPFRLSEVKRLATEAGMNLQADGSYVLRDIHGGIAYTLTNQGEQAFQGEGAVGTTHGVTLLFDVTSAAGGVGTFDHMAGLAASLAKALGGNLVDDNGRHVGHDSLQKIRQRLSKAHADMAAHGIPAGGERARRLFA